MSYYGTRDRQHGMEQGGEGEGVAQRAPGKRTLTQGLPPAQRKAAEGAGGGATGMPAAVQAKMEDAFDFDFSAVRIHEGPQAEAIGARAYTQGTDIHFAPGEYAPEDHAGQFLLGHELAHVVQQSAGRVSATTQAKGIAVNDDGGLEHEADVAGAAAARGEKVSIAGGGGGVQCKTASAPVQMAAKDTHYGTFTDEKYELTGNYVEMVLKFTPNDKVDAKKIGLTQSLRSYVAGNNAPIDPTTANRMSPSGHFIDAMSDENNPLYAQSVQNGGKLADTPKDANTTQDKTNLNPDQGDVNSNYELGWRYQNQGGAVVAQDAGLRDKPTVAGGNNSGKEFETAALAIEGTQADTYYGSVKWGWRKDAQGAVTKIELDVVSMGVPSEDFLDAAAAWNQSSTRGTLSPKQDGTMVYDRDMKPKFQMDRRETGTQFAEVFKNGELYVGLRVNHNGQHAVFAKVSEWEDRGDGADVVALPVVTVQLVKEDAEVYADKENTQRTETLAKGTRCKVTATDGAQSKIEVVDGDKVGIVGWLAKEQLWPEKLHDV